MQANKIYYSLKKFSVSDNYGIGAYAVFLFLLTIWWSLNWEDASACPYTHLEEVVEGKVSVFIAGAKIFAEMAGGLLIFKYRTVGYCFTLPYFMEQITILKLNSN